MSVNIKTLILEAIQETLKVAQHQTQKQRPIENLNAQSICDRFSSKKVEQGHKATIAMYWLSAFIESDAGLDEAIELDEVVEQVEGWIQFRL